MNENDNTTIPPTDPPPAEQPKGEPVYLVRLRSGGPPMTVGGSTKEGLIVVAWFAGNDMKSATLHPSMVVPVKEQGT